MTASPIGAAERHRTVDALRGIALLGIVIVNMELFTAALDAGWSERREPLDLAAQWLVVAFAQGKFYLLFSLLFGYGLALQLRRGGDDPAAARRYRRRMFALIGLGAAHAVLLFAGDILLSYGLLGLLLFGMRRTSSPELLRTALVVYAAGMAVIALLGATVAFADEPAGRDPAAIEAAYLGSFGEGVAQRIEDLVLLLPSLIFVQWPSAFAMFLVGLVIGRTRLLAEPERYRALLRRGLRWSAPVGLAGGALAATLVVGSPERVGLGYGAGLIIQLVTAPALTAAYVCALALWLPRRLERRPITVIRSAGRASLTVYLGQSLAAAWIVSGWGLGLFGSVGPAAGLGLALAIWAGLALAAHAWLARFRFGPCEWLLRSVTYGRRQPLRTSP